MDTERPPTGPLITAEQLADRLGDPDLRICDVRWYLGEADRARSEYEDAHIAGAVFVDLDRDLSAHRGSGRHPLPDPVRFAATLGRLGISPGATVVIYDSAGGSIAARMWWMLQKLGHRQAFVLDGGWQTWTDASRPVEGQPRIPDPVAYPVLMSSWPDTVTIEDIQTDSETSIVDARAPERYAGVVEPVDARPGHIPRAVNLPHTDNLTTEGRFRPAEELAARFGDLGDQPIMYCGSGVTACGNILAMELAGIPGARLYAGSWSEWAADADLPAELGS